MARRASAKSASKSKPRATARKQAAAPRRGRGQSKERLREAGPYFKDIDGLKPDEEMLELARELIERKSAPFEPEKFHDRYTEVVRDLIEAKRKNEKRVAVDEEELPSRGAEVIDLVDALKRSVKGAGRDAAEPRRKKA